MQILRFLLIAILSWCLSCITQLPPGDCVIFLGDSITQYGISPDGYITLVAEAIGKAYPERPMKVIGAGVSGNRVPDCRKRLKRDVLKKRPSKVVIVIGINDVWHWENDQGTTKAMYRAGLIDIIERITKAKAEVVLCTPTVIGEKNDGSNKYDVLLDEYSDISRAVALQTGVKLLDLRKEFMQYLKKNNPENKSVGILTKDSVHLNKRGNRLLADLVIKALNISVKH